MFSGVRKIYNKLQDLVFFDKILNYNLANTSYLFCNSLQLCFKVRLLDGTTITTVFKALEPLAAVRVYVQMNTPEDQDFTLLSPYPRRVYTELDMEKPLKELGEHCTENLDVKMILRETPPDLLPSNFLRFGAFGCVGCYQKVRSGGSSP